MASLDKDQETRPNKFTKEARSDSEHEAKRRSMSERAVNGYFSPYGFPSPGGGLPECSGIKKEPEDSGQVQSRAREASVERSLTAAFAASRKC